ncbi:MAG TPA: hypothetical protein VM325_01470 [Alphaproteobacteria bacterium]|jgi:hypothetical protein|nr:hypothetical protein [Alphaproteobacteria bacterium]
MPNVFQGPLRVAVIATAATLALTACGDGGGGETGLPGSWKVAEASGPMAKSNKGVSYKFDKDGKVLLGGFNKCTYTHATPDLAIKCGPVTITWKAELKDGGKTLVLTNPSGKQVLTLKRG